MMLISLIHRPIIFYLRLFCPSIAVRTLADDILLTQDGDDASEFVDAFNRLHYFLHKLGAKLAPDTSYVFLPALILESFLNLHLEHINTKIPVVLSFRTSGLI